MTSLMNDVTRDGAVLVGTFAVHLAAFVVCTTLVSAGLGLAMLVGGMFLLLAALVVAGWAARMSRALLGAAGHPLPRRATPSAGRAWAGGCAGSPPSRRGGTCSTSW